MNKDRILGLIAGVLTVNLIAVVGVLSYLYSVNRDQFKWAVFVLFVMVVVVIMYAYTKRFLSDFFDQSK